MFDSPCHDAGTRSYVQPNDIKLSGERSESAAALLCAGFRSMGNACIRLAFEARPVIALGKEQSERLFVLGNWKKNKYDSYKDREGSAGNKIGINDACQ